MDFIKKVLMRIKKHYIITGVLLIGIGFLFSFFSKDHQFISKKVAIYDNEKQVFIDKDYLELQPKYFWLNFFSTLFTTFGITVWVTMFFSHFFEQEEQKQFEEKIQSIQKETGKNVITNLYKEMIDESFYNTVKEELMECNLVRTNVLWHYDIVELPDNKMKLIRQIQYTVKNISNREDNEIIKINAFSNQYEQTKITDIRIKKQSDQEYKKILETIINNKEKLEVGHFESIQAGQSLEIIKEVEQIFNVPYIYETHFANSPIKDLKIEVNLPENYEFELSYKNIVNDESIVTTLNRRKIYTFNRALLKGQGFEFYCYKTNQLENNSTIEKESKP